MHVVFVVVQLRIKELEDALEQERELRIKVSTIRQKASETWRLTDLCRFLIVIDLL